MIADFAPAARDELDAAADHYEEERPGRGMRFYTAGRAHRGAARRVPGCRTAASRYSAELGVRRRIIRGFPFVLVYRVLGDTLRIDAVAHMHRRPGYWRRRIR